MSTVLLVVLILAFFVIYSWCKSKELRYR